MAPFPASGRIGADRVAASFADGQDLGWRLCIAADGSWLFYVSMTV